MPNTTRKGQQGDEDERQGDSKRGQGGGASMKEREYRDASGEIHHHTKKYMEQHGNSSSRKKK